jgi:hypothetical protein
VKRIAWIALMCLPAAAFGQNRNHDRDWKAQDQETIKRTFDFSGTGPRKLTVDNFSGYIHVTGYDGNTVRMTALRRNRAESNETLAEAKRDVKLDAAQEGNSVRLYVDGPFRHNQHGDHYGYDVIFDFDLEVPRGAELALKGFNHGTVEVKGTSRASTAASICRTSPDRAPCARSTGR